MSRLRLDIWSDIACPWCYVGKRRLELALEKFPERAEVEIFWHSFELDPSAPREMDTTQTHAEWLAKKYRMSVEAAQRRIDQLTALARADGLDFRFDRLRPGNTFDAHRLLQLAKTKRLQDKLMERFMRGYLTDGAPIGRRDALLELAVEIGLDRDEVHDTLESGSFGAEVRAEEQRAGELGIHAVPFFVLAERYAVSGAQPPELLLAALTKAWSDIAPSSEKFVDDAVCGPDGC
jgi:predicted DsbA family dithiol-disulfide isomerase